MNYLFTGLAIHPSSRASLTPLWSYSQMRFVRNLNMSSPFFHFRIYMVNIFCRRVQDQNSTDPAGGRVHSTNLGRALCRLHQLSEYQHALDALLTAMSATWIWLSASFAWNLGVDPRFLSHLNLLIIDHRSLTSEVVIKLSPVSHLRLSATNPRMLQPLHRSR